jgi:membrane-bound lytic murein transglycosylase D
MLLRAALVLCLSLVVSACATVSKTNSSADTSRDLASSEPAVAPFESPNEIDKILEETNPVLAEMTGGEGEKVPLQIPIEINRKVAQWIKFFTVRERELTQRYLQRGEALRPHIEQILKENEVPQELYFLAMIESGFVAHAKSRAKAVGVWQFMKGTALNYGLSVSNHVDERRNWIKSTEAAASYLKDLNNVFGSWYLALAAYNAGEYRIVRSIMKGKTRDFWALAEAGLLPKETLDYVPKFLAAHIVGKNRKRFGFDIKVDEQDKWDDFESVSVPAGARLSDISKSTGVPHDVLKRWNFDLLKGVTPYSKTGTVEIYVPKSHVAKLEENKDALAQLKRYKTGAEDQRSYASAGGEKGSGSYSMYIVRRGENLTMISRRLGISVRTLMKLNGLRKGRIHPGQRLKYYGVGSSAMNSDSSNRSVASTERKSSKKLRRNN